MATHDDATRPDEPRRAWVTDGSADIEDLQLDPRNANRGTPRGRALLESSLREYGAGRAVLTDRDGVLIAGNKTFEVAQRLGIPTRVIETDGQELVVVRRRDLRLASDPQARALAIADNRVGELDLAWDPAILQQLQADGLDLGLFWTTEEFERLLGEGTHAGQTDENAVVTPGATDIVRGDLFALGRHRLLCGDATDPADVHHLLEGQVPGLLVTDPPYGVAYDPAWRHRMDPRQRTAVGRVANDDRVDWRAAVALFGGDVAYVWHAGLFAGPVAAALQSSGFALRSQIIWVKQHFALSRGEMHWAHEPCWYAVRKGRPSHWQGDRRQTTVWDVPNLNPFGGSREGENAVSGHGTQKPVRLWERPILHHTTTRDTLYDPFCGSGTAVIAAEKTGRTCVAMDLDPQYIHVTRTRWEAFTGQRARPLPGGRREDPMRNRADAPPRPPRRTPRGGKGGAEPRRVIRGREHPVLTLTEQGWRQEAIADHLGITQAAVSKILRRVDERALRVVADQVAYRKMRGARHLEYLSREGRRGWEQSKQGRVRRRQTKGALADGTPVVTQDVVIDEHPDPRMLDQARKAEEALADLLGSTSSAGRSDPRPQTDLPPLLQLSDETLERIDAELTPPRDPQDDPQ